MPNARIVFHKLIQDSQTFDSFQPSDEHMVSVLHFDYESDGKATPMTAEVRQPFGTGFGDAIEVERPAGQKGPWNQHAFADACERYYRLAIGRILGDPVTAKGLRMRNNTIVQEQVVEIEIPQQPGGGW